MKREFWNERYSAHQMVYGVEPNEFFREQLLKIEPGKLLLPAEGEGRNALFAARHGWDVHAFDYSEIAKQKALAFANRFQVKIEYDVADINQIKLPAGLFNVVGLIYVHLEPDVRRAFHRQCVIALRRGGSIILEAFSQDQINNKSGGPKDINMLYILDDLLEDFDGLEMIYSKEEDIFLDEGNFHVGIADVIRIVASKK